MARRTHGISPLLIALSVAACLPAVATAAPPKTFDQFRQAAEAAKEEPEVLAALFVQGLILLRGDGELGEDMLSLILRQDDLYEEKDNKSGFRMGRTMRREFRDAVERENLLEGYCGGSPAKHYKDASLANCAVHLDKRYSASKQGVGFPKEGRAKFFIHNDGSSRPRPIELEYSAERKRWEVRTFSGLFTGVSAPPEE